MKKVRPILLKIGGSVITDKNEDLKPQTQAISRLAEEIHKANPQKLVIVHGGGSFGHPLAKRYHLTEGFKEEKQKTGFSETHHVMTVLNGLFMDELIERDIPAVSIPPSSCMITKNGRIQFSSYKIIKNFLDMGFLPVLYGDVVLDSTLGFTVLSGDQIISALATEFKADRIIIGVDVDGLYDADPNIKKSAEMFTHLTLRDLKKLQNQLSDASTCDVTGGMAGKMSELLSAIDQGIPVTIVNATKPNYIYKTLKGKEVKGTQIEKE